MEDIQQTINNLLQEDVEAFKRYCSSKGHLFVPRLHGMNCVIVCKLCGELHAEYYSNKKVCK